MKIYHIVSGLSAAGNLRYSIKKNMVEWYGEIIAIPDDFSVGPLCDLSNGINDERQNWLLGIMKMIGEADVFKELHEMNRKMLEQLNQIGKEDKIVIWYGPNSMELITLYQICHKFRFHNLFKSYTGDLQITATLESPNVGACNQEQILELLKEIQPLARDEKVNYANELGRLLDENEMVRLFKDDIVISEKETFYDALILSNATNVYMKAARVVGGTMGQSKYLVGDTFIDYRVRVLINSGQLMHTKNKKLPMRFMSVKLP